MKFCEQCGFEFNAFSAKYYCCDSQRPVCILCRRKVCSLCRSDRTIEIKTPQCYRCHNRLDDSGLLEEYNCGRHFCSKCTAAVFKNMYRRVSVEKAYPDRQIFVKMFCGHDYPYNGLLSFFQNFCINCGRDYEVALDYQMEDGAKLCHFCFYSSRKTYEDCFLKCMMCETVIQNAAKAEVVEKNELVLCQQCSKQSKIGEELIDSNKKYLGTQESYLSRNQPTAIDSKASDFQPSSSGQKEQKSRGDQQGLKLNAEQSQEKRVKSHEPSPDQHRKGNENVFNKFLKKPSISELKERQLERKESQREKNSFSVTSKFSSEAEYFDDNVTEELGVSQKIKMKKHLSHETFVENLKLTVNFIKPEQLTQCHKCHSLIKRDNAFDLLQSKTEGSGSEPTDFVDFEEIRTEGPRISEGSKFFCRICYHESNERKQSLKQNPFSSRIKKVSQVSNRATLAQSSKDPHLLGVGSQFNQRSTRSPSSASMLSPFPVPSYNLTGSRVKEQNREFQKVPTESMNTKPKTDHSSMGSTLGSHHETINISEPTVKPAKVSSKEYPKVCNICHEAKYSSVATLSQGNVCTDCYHRKSPHIYRTFHR